MAWVKIKTTDGSIISVPETLYNTLYKENKAYSLVDEPKPTPQKYNKGEIVKDGEQVQRFSINENGDIKKSTKKTI